MANARELGKRQTRRAAIGDRPSSRIKLGRRRLDPTVEKHAPDWLTKA